MRKTMVLGFALLAACSSAPKASQAQAPGSPQDSAGRALVRPGYGTLKQDELTMALRSGALLVKVTPLSERVIRLAAPDTYNRLHALAESRRAEAAQQSNVESPEIFMVSFFSYEPDVNFQPEDLQLEHQGRNMRAAAIIPLTPGWGKQRMSQQETQAAIYVFGDRVDYDLPLVLRYGLDQSSDWQRIIPKLEVERAKVKARASEN